MNDPDDPDDPDDPGGATNYGVTVGTMRRLKLDLTGDGEVSTADVRALTREKAKGIFIRGLLRAAPDRRAAGSTASLGL